MLEILNRIQSEQVEWVNKNFSDRQDWNPALGLIEELGELAHAVLKDVQNVRIDQDHFEGRKDSVGDIMIYMSDFCTAMGIGLASVVEADQKNTTFIVGAEYLKIFDLNKCLSAILVRYTQIINRDDNTTDGYLKLRLLLFQEIGRFVNELRAYCMSANIDFFLTVEKTWDKVKLRDWTKNNRSGEGIDR